MRAEPFCFFLYKLLDSHWAQRQAGLFLKQDCPLQKRVEKIKGVYTLRDYRKTKGTLFWVKGNGVEEQLSTRCRLVDTMI